MTNTSPFKYLETSPEIIELAVTYCIRHPLSFRQVDDILHEREIDTCHEAVRFWRNRFGPIFVRKIRQRRPNAHSKWRWQIDEVFVKINGERFYLWRAIDHESVELESIVSKRRDRQAALKILKKLLSRYGSPQEIVTDKLASYGAAMRLLNLKIGTKLASMKTTTSKIRICISDDARGRWGGSDPWLRYRNSRPSMLRSSTSSVIRDTPSVEPTLSSLVINRRPIGAKFARCKLPLAGTFETA